MHKSILHLHIQLGEPFVIGETRKGKLKIIPILGGEVLGIFEGSILPFGGDFNIKHNAYTSDVDACYILETALKERILIRNRGFIDKQDGFQETKPVFITAKDSKFSYLMEKEYIGRILKGGSTNIDIEILEVL